MYVPKCAVCNDRKFSEFGGIRKLCELCKTVDEPASAAISPAIVLKTGGFNLDLSAVHHRNFVFSKTHEETPPEAIHKDFSGVAIPAVLHDSAYRIPPEDFVTRLADPQPEKKQRGRPPNPRLSV
jgi:hypothetical protein